MKVDGALGYRMVGYRASSSQNHVEQPQYPDWFTMGQDRKANQSLFVSTIKYNDLMHIIVALAKFSRIYRANSRVYNVEVNCFLVSIYEFMRSKAKL